MAVRDSGGDSGTRDPAREPAGVGSRGDGLRRPEGEYAGHSLGEERARRRADLPPRRETHERGGRGPSGGAGRAGRELRADPAGLRHRGAERRLDERRHRRHAAVRVRHPHVRAEPGTPRRVPGALAGLEPHLRRLGQELPPQCRSAACPHLQRADASVEREHELDLDRDEPVDGPAAGRADGAAHLRRAGGLLQREPGRLRPQRPEGRHAHLRDAVAARAQRHRGLPARRTRGPGQAHHLLPRSRHAGEVAPVPDPGNRGLAGSLRGGGLQQRDPGADAALLRRGPRVQPGGRALFGDPLAPVGGSERVRTACARPANGRDPRERHPVVPQRREPAAELVPDSDGGRESGGAPGALRRRGDGPADPFRRRSRGRAHHRTPAQHEVEFRLPRRLAAGPGVRVPAGGRAVDHGLRALQLRRATGGRGRVRGPADRRIRPLRDQLGLPPDRRRGRGRGTPDARRVDP